MHVIAVLILVLMEYTLRDERNEQFFSYRLVLILVLMEYTLRDICKDADVKNFDKVLILVLMEYTLREF